MTILRFEGRDLLMAVEKARAWVLRTTGAFSGFQLGKECGLDHPDLRNQVIDELVSMHILEPDGQRHNWFRRVANDCPEIDWVNAEEDPFPIWLPLGLNEQAIISPGNVIVVAGETNGGKTAFGLNVAAKNLPSQGGAHREVYLFNSEMGPTELRGRLLNFQPREEWAGLRVFSRSRDFHHVLRPDGLNIIDYLEIHDEFWQVGGIINKIHAALGYGVAVVLMQKKKGTDYARGGEFTAEKARLALSLSWDGFVNTCKITKCKAPAGTVNPDGQEIEFTISRGATMLPISGWEYVTAKERQKRTDRRAQTAQSREQAQEAEERGYQPPVQGRLS